MAWVIESGLLESQNVGIFHGGAGPQDPKADQFSVAIDELQQSIRLAYQDEWPETYSQAKDVDSLTQREHKATLWAAASVAFLEASPMFNAGYGSALQEDGQPRVSAALMENQKSVFSAVANAERLIHPSFLVRHLQFYEHRVLDGQGAKNLAQSLRVPTADLITERRHQIWLDYQRRQKTGKTGTVGAVTRSNEFMAAMTSTGGIGNEVVGRIGDCPTVAGNYCSPSVAVSCTGIGEQITSMSLASRLSFLVEDGKTLEEASELVLRQADEREFRLAFIALHRQSDKTMWIAGTANTQMVWSVAFSTNQRRSVLEFIASKTTG